MPRFCASCGGQMEDSATFCAACGTAVGQPAGAVAAAPAPTAAQTAPAAASGGIEDNIAGLLAYITIIPAIVFLVMEPYNKKPFVRFHAFQCLFLAVAAAAVGIVLIVISAIPFVGLLMLFVGPLFVLAILAILVVCAIKAYQGEKFKLPIIGDLAEKQANA